ncbi:hypothetical protein Hypma_005547 [Hypsizygus marmoreus]|uniref:Uncharacterized protein n=1 Tax=Hypsizygus marmoreus TaxID=39966 RepID=A0A369JZ60_HYPMA|nr:hypothetical protein Hypma_005547 [Hypsizygus marmoreus]
MEPHFLASLGLKKLREYREFAFPRALADKNSNPCLTLGNARDWANPDAVKCFLGVTQELNLGDAASNTLWEISGSDVLTDYLNWLVPEALAARSHQQSVIKKEVKAEDLATNRHLQAVALGKRKAGPQQDHEIIEISDDDEPSSSFLATRTSKKPKRHSEQQPTVGSAVIDLTDDTDNNARSSDTALPRVTIGSTDSAPPSVSQSRALPPSSNTASGKSSGRSKPQRECHPDAQIKITASEYVTEIVQLKAIPAGWDISKTTLLLTPLTQLGEVRK